MITATTRRCTRCEADKPHRDYHGSQSRVCKDCLNESRNRHRKQQFELCCCGEWWHVRRPRARRTVCGEQSIDVPERMKHTFNAVEMLHDAGTCPTCRAKLAEVFDG